MERELVELINGIVNDAAVSIDSAYFRLLREKNVVDAEDKDLNALVSALNESRNSFKTVVNKVNSLVNRTY